MRKSEYWASPQEGLLTFNVDEVARGKLGLTSIGGVLHSSEGEVFDVVF